MNKNITVESDARHHTMQIKKRMNELIDHLRDDVEKIEEPRAKALFETAAEVLVGLVTAFEHYESKSEEAWKHGH